MSNDFTCFVLQFTDIELIPYVRMTQRTRFTDKYAIRYREQQQLIRQLIALDLASQGLPLAGEDYAIPKDIPFSAHIFIYTAKPLHRCDLDNQVKAVLDACQKVVYPNDSQCDSIAAIRTQLEKGKPGWFSVQFTPYN